MHFQPWTRLLHTLRRPRRPQHAPRQDFVAEIRTAVFGLKDHTTESLVDACQRARQRVMSEGVDSPKATIEAFAVATEAVERGCGIRLYDAQLRAACVLARGEIAEMQTGEGKTLSCIPAAVLHGLTGRGVHVATPNMYLAERDHQLAARAVQMLGLCVGLVPEQAPASDKHSAYQADITYGAANEFGFDYLRDQLSLREASNRSLGERILRNASTQDGTSADAASMIQRGLYFSIVDEADNVLIDDAASPLILSGPSDREAPDAEIHRLALHVAKGLTLDEHYCLNSDHGGVSLTPAGVEWIHRDENQPPIDQLRRMWSEYVKQAIASSMLQRDIHYIVDNDGAIQIVDTSTGRIFSDRTWRDGLHQAVEAKEGVTVTGERLALAQITRQRFSRLYERLAGMTGTAASCSRELKHVYQLTVRPIPLRTPSRREIWTPRFFARQQQKWTAIADSAATISQSGRPVLIGTRSIADSHQLADLFRERNLTFQLLNGRQDKAEAEIIAEAGRRHAVTIATSLAGRGTDIRLDPSVAELGGLHVMVSECDESYRIDRQLVGRCARQGDPGSAQIYVSAEDSLIRQHGVWLARAIRRHADERGECTINLLPQVHRIQRAAERAAYGARAALLRRDLARDTLLNR